MNAIRKKYIVKEDNEFQNLMINNLTDDFKAMKNPGFYIECIKQDNQVAVLIFGEPSLVKKIGEFSKHLEGHYKAESV